MVTSSDIKCKRCGKDIPALSDCGGFYDLVPSARKATEGYTEPVVAPEKLISSPQHPETPKGATPVRSKKSSKKSLLGLTMITILGFALVILLLVIRLGKINQHSEAINALQTDIQNITEKSDTATEPPTTESSDALAPVLSKQNVVFTVIVNGDEEKKVNTSLDLGDYCDTAFITYDTVDANGLLSFASYSLKEAGTSTSFTIDYTNGVRTWDISVNYVVDDAIYSLAEASPVCKWQYRFDDSTEWEDISRDAFTQTDKNGKTEISIKADTSYYSGYTEAYMASRLCAGSFYDQFRRLFPCNQSAVSLTKEIFAPQTSQRLIEFGPPKDETGFQIKGSSVRTLPSTAAVALMQQDADGSVLVTAIWAGDSRVYSKKLFISVCRQNLQCIILPTFA